MANCSNVYGTMILVGDWADEMIQNLNTITDCWRCGEYYTDVQEDFEKVDESVSFSAVGRWCYDGNLRNLGMWTLEIGDSKQIEAYRKLCNELKDKVDEDGVPTAYIIVEFKEDEPGCTILRECTTEIYLTQEDIHRQYLSGDIDKHNLMARIIEETHYDYTVENLYNLDFYDSLEDARELFINEDGENKDIDCEE